jgi:hypothetical protein
MLRHIHISVMETTPKSQSDDLYSPKLTLITWHYLYVGDTGSDIFATCAYYFCSRFHNTKFVLWIRDARAVVVRMGPK